MSPRKGRIYVVEDDQSFRKSVTRLIKASGFEVVELDSADSFLSQHSIRRPACLLLDVQLPGIDGLSLQQRLIDEGRDLPIIFMTGHGSIPMSVKAMKKGAVDFLPKPFEAEDLRDAVLRALERDVQSMETELQLKKAGSLIDTLTPREKEVMQWVITGKLNKQIADALGITEKTVKVHRGRVMEKTGVTSVAELVRLAEKANIPPALG
jgi:FixJ family two-component response regulator